MLMYPYQLSEEELLLEESGAYRIVLHSQRNRDTNWMAFATREAFNSFLSSYHGILIEEPAAADTLSYSFTVDMPEVRQVNMPSKFFDIIDNYHDVLYHYNTGIDILAFLDGVKSVQREDGEVFYKGKLIPCKKFFFYEEDNEVPIRCLECIKNTNLDLVREGEI